MSVVETRHDGSCCTKRPAASGPRMSGPGSTRTAASRCGFRINGGIGRPDAGEDAPRPRRLPWRHPPRLAGAGAASSSPGSTASRSGSGRTATRGLNRTGAATDGLRLRAVAGRPGERAPDRRRATERPAWRSARSRSSSGRTSLPSLKIGTPMLTTGFLGTRADAFAGELDSVGICRAAWDRAPSLEGSPAFDGTLGRAHCPACAGGELAFDGTLGASRAPHGSGDESEPDVALAGTRAPHGAGMNQSQTWLSPALGPRTERG